MSNKIIENMVEWVESNLERTPTLEKMSAYVGYSPFYCSSKFHEYVGISFRTYINKRRLSLAAIELKKSDDRILDIAIKYGFSSHEAFTRAFNKNYGCTPIQFRKLLPEINLYPKAEVLHNQVHSQN